MAGPRLFALVSLLVLAAGCAAPDRPAGTELLETVDPAPLEVLPTERQVAASSLWHEERHDTVPEPAQDGFIIENTWEPRDVELTYHGVQPVYDEWARQVLAHVFRYDVMGLVVTDVEFLGVAGVRITARYEASPVEFAFAASDARFLGAVHLEHGLRGFDDHRWPTPLAGGYVDGLFAALAYQFLGGDLARPIVTPFGQLTHNETDLRPLLGDCQPYELVFDPAPWYQQWMDDMQGPESAAPKAPAEVPRDLVCLEDEGAPVWSYRGNASEHLRLERRGLALPTPELSGAPLPPVIVPTRPFEPVDMLLGLAKPVHVPPSASPGDWADQVRPVVQAAGTNLDYVQWQLDAERIFLGDVYKAFPYLGLPLPTSPGAPTIPSVFEETSWVMMHDGDGMFWAFVDSRYGGPEDPDLHASPRGYSFDDYPVRERQVVASGEVQQAWDPLLPGEPAFLAFSTFPDLLQDEPQEMRDLLEPFFVSWSALEFCWEERDDGRFGFFSAVNGQMLALGAQTSVENGCGSGVQGDGFLRLSSGGMSILLRPRQGDQPGVLVLPELGKAYVLGQTEAGRVPLTHEAAPSAGLRSGLPSR